MQRKILLVTFIGGLTMLSSCVTSFETGQEAATLPKNNLGVGFEGGVAKLALNARYGLSRNLDIGASGNFRINDFSGKASNFSFSSDLKWQFFGVPQKHFVISTGLGFGTGVERTTLWNEVYEPATEDAWYFYGGTSYDGYLPLYFSYYVANQHDNTLLSFNLNPYVVYRLGFYDNYTGLGPGDTFTGYQTLNQFFSGTAFSIGVGGSKKFIFSRNEFSVCGA